MKNVLRVVITILLLADLSQSFAQFPGCPSVVTSPVGVIPCGQTCTNLYASAEGGFSTTTYTYATIPYAPPVAFNVGTGIPIPGSNGDDYWSPLITLPFNFCYFGNTYKQVVVSSNGAISFDAANAGVIPSSWEITGTAPANQPADMLNCVMTPWQDLDNTHQGQIFYDIGGTAPCQYFTASWYNCAMYGDAESTNTGYCTLDDHQYQQVILYQTSNVIDINIQAKAVPCDNVTSGTYWNGGLAIEGLVNAAGTTFIGPAARNATQWSATNDAIRFTPNGTPTYTITWFQGTTQIGTGSPFQVCPTGPTTYIAKATYTNCDNSVITVSDSVFVDLARLTVSDSVHQPTCGSNNGSVYASFNGNSGVISYGWAPGGAGDTVLHNLGPGTYIFTVSDSAGCTKADTVTLSPNGGTTVTVANDTFNSCTSGATGTLIATVTGTGPFTYAWSNSAGTTDTVTGLAAGTYTVTVTAPGGCTATATGTVVSLGSPPVVTVTPDTINACSGATGTLIATVTGTGPFTYAWSNSAGTTDTVTGLALGTYTVTVTSGICTATATGVVTSLTGPPVIIHTIKLVNATCSNDSNGQIIVAASGGPPPYTFAWSNGGSTDSIGGLGGGTYTVTVTDRFGCSTDTTYTITQGAPITFNTPVIVNVSCNGGNNGSITVSATGGVNPYTYAWNDTHTGAKDSNLIAGTYIVTATDSNGCTASATYNVGQAAPIVFGTPVIDSVSCFGGSNGSITATASGGTGPIGYKWNINNDSTATAGNLSAGTYVVTATDSVGCTASASYTVSQPTQIVVDSIVLDSATCAAGGSIIIAVSGGTPGYTYSWSNLGSGDSIGGLAGGTYTVTISDSHACSITASGTVPTAPNVVAFGPPVIVEPTCNGNANGSITATASGGTGVISFAWSNVDSVAKDSNLVAGTYSVTITDQSGCSASTTYVLSQPAPVAITSAVIDSVLCNGTNTGSIIITASGGTGTLTYSWSPNSSTSDSAMNLGAGTYTVIVTDSLLCSTTASYTVGQPTAITDTAVVNPAGCTTGGSIIVTTSGGTGTLTYTWSVPGTGDSIGNLAAGNYSVTIADQNGCSVTASYTVTAVAGAVIIDSASVVNVTCNGDSSGSITVVATDSSAGGKISYLWANGDTTASITGLKAGNYCVTVTDSLGCSASACYNVNQPTAITFGSPVLTPPACNSDSNGCILASASGGSGTIIYTWSNLDTGANDCGLKAGTYTVTATDSLGCSASASYTLSQPTPDSISAVVSNITCNGLGNGSITVTATGGAGGFTYVWAGGIIGATRNNLGVGQYCVTATDANLCSVTACYNITQPPALILNAIVSTPVTCTALGTDSVSVSGGTGTLTYSWAPSGQTTAVATNLTAANYCVTVTDSLSCTLVACDTVKSTAGTVTIDSAHVTNVTCSANGSIIVYASGGNTGLTYTWSVPTTATDTLTNLSSGTYSVTVADSTGCSASASYTVNPATPVTISNVVIDSAKCNGNSNGSITITASGTGPLTYVWSPNVSTTNSATGLSAGQYCVTITDTVGCSATACYTVGQPLAISVSGTVTNVTCSLLGTISVTASGGTGTLNYTWLPTGTGANLTGLASGTYYLTVTDQNGCSALDTFKVTGSSGSAITISNIVIDSVTCFGGNNGSITITATGGSGTLTYLWAPNLETSASDTALVAGTYGVVVSDTSGCSATGGPYTVGQPPAINVSGVVTNATCTTPGSIAVTASGGTGILTPSWSPNTVSGFNPTGLSAGNYTVTVTDQHGCTATATFTINGTAGAITLTDVITNVTCNGAGNGSIAVTPSGGTGYSYSWNPSTVGTGGTVTNLGPGTYSVTVTASGGCSASASYTVTQPGAISITLTAPSTLCSGVDTGTASVVVNSGGQAPYSYHWSNNADTLSTDTGLQSGNVAVTVTDANGCTVSASKAIGQDLFDFGDNIIQPNCSHPIPSLEVAITISGTPPYTYTLNGVSHTTTDSSYIFDSIFPGTYLLTVQDGNGCLLSQSPVVNTPAATDSVGAIVTPTSCTSVDNGQITVYVAAIDSSHSPFTYSINGGSFAPDSGGIFTGLAPGSYTIVVHNNLGCYDTIATPIIVTSDSVLTVTFPYDTVGPLPSPGAINSDTITLMPNVTGFVNPVYSWSPSTGLSCTSCPNPVYIADPSATVNGPIVYRVLVSDSLTPQCAAYDSVVIIPKGQFAMPNAFTPNGDGVDDLFGPVKYSYVTVTTFHIYNRWGQLVHNSTDYWDGKFDGKDQPEGAYVYYIEVTVTGGATGYDYGVTTTQKKEGSVILLR